MKRLKSQVQVSGANDTAYKCNAGTCQSEKAGLRNDLEVANATIKDLKAKIKYLENEKSSLTTAIRIIQEDNSQRANRNYDSKDNQEENPFVEVKRKERKRKRKRRHVNEKPREHETPKKSPLEENVSQSPLETPPETANPTGKDGHVNNKGSNHTKAAKVMVVGDSIVKHINGYKMSKPSTRVQVSSFPGCTTLDMADHIKPILRKNLKS